MVVKQPAVKAGLVNSRLNRVDIRFGVHTGHDTRTGRQRRSVALEVHFIDIFWALKRGKRVLLRTCKSVRSR
jgi:hypothetical protein